MNAITVLSLFFVVTTSNSTFAGGGSRSGIEIKVSQAARPTKSPRQKNEYRNLEDFALEDIRVERPESGLVEIVKEDFLDAWNMRHSGEEIPTHLLLEYYSGILTEMHTEPRYFPIRSKNRDNSVLNLIREFHRQVYVNTKGRRSYIMTATESNLNLLVSELAAGVPAFEQLVLELKKVDSEGKLKPILFEIAKGFKEYVDQIDMRPGDIDIIYRFRDKVKFHFQSTGLRNRLDLMVNKLTPR